MKTWIIEPRDSLIVRDGRPFGLGAGMRATSLDFPFPSTTTGGVRTRAGLDAQGIFDTNLISTVKGIGVKGPLLVELDNNGEICDWLMPAPSDALLMRVEGDDKKAEIKRLAPINVAPDLMNLSKVNSDLLPVGRLPEQNEQKQKPLDDAPRYWRWEKFNQWLIGAKDFPVELKSLGHSGPEKDSRVHASINDSLTTGETGENNLFQTRGLEFRRILSEEKLKDTKRLALVVLVDDKARAQNVEEGIAPLGGERRLVVWRDDTNDKTNDIRRCPVKKEIAESGYCRLILLTPAFFKSGSYPEKLLQAQHGITPKLKAIAHNRYQVVSGWDFEIDKPKPTRRLVPSGAVLFLELDGDKGKREEWIEKTWLSCVSDTETENKDGFGLAMLGAWDGNLLEME
ncbi:MAG: type III-B CRISPR module-associated protein Cmr3 [Pyrinomonadaceae bacterium]